MVKKDLDSEQLINPLADRLGYQLRRVSVFMMEGLTKALEPLDLRPSEVSVLLLIEANENIRQRQVGQQLGIKRANLTPIMVALEDRKLIKRVPFDGRSHSVRLTSKGKKIITQAEVLMKSNEARFVEDIDKKTKGIVMEFLRSIRSAP